MGLFDASTSNGGSWSQGTSSAQSASNSWGWSNTAGNIASAVAEARAQEANAMQEYFMDKTMSYNSYEARLQREWEEHMAATQYQRAVADLRAAGLNPVLAASKGIGSATGGGASANVGIPSAFMGKTFAEQNSASGSESWMNSLGENWSQSWNHSESGLATFLTSMLGLAETALANLNSAKTFEVNVAGLDKVLNPNKQTLKEAGRKVMDGAVEGTKNILDAFGTPLGRLLKNNDKGIAEYEANKKKGVKNVFK